MVGICFPLRQQQIVKTSDFFIFFSISIQIGAGSPHQPYMMRGVSPMTNPLRGLSCSSSINKDSQFVTNITVKQSQRQDIRNMLF